MINIIHSTLPVWKLIHGKETQVGHHCHRLWALLSAETTTSFSGLYNASVCGFITTCFIFSNAVCCGLSHINLLFTHFTNKLCQFRKIFDKFGQIANKTKKWLGCLFVFVAPSYFQLLLPLSFNKSCCNKTKLSVI